MQKQILPSLNLFAQPTSRPMSQQTNPDLRPVSARTGRPRTEVKIADGGKPSTNIEYAL